VRSIESKLAVTPTFCSARAAPAAVNAQDDSRGDFFRSLFRPSLSENEVRDSRVSPVLRGRSFLDYPATPMENPVITFLVSDSRCPMCAEASVRKPACRTGNPKRRQGQGAQKKDVKNRGNELKNLLKTKDVALFSVRKRTRNELRTNQGYGRLQELVTAVKLLVAKAPWSAAAKLPPWNAATAAAASLPHSKALYALSVLLLDFLT